MRGIGGARVKDEQRIRVLDTPEGVIGGRGTLTRTILFVIGDLDVGGTENHLVQILPRLARRGIRPLVYTLTRKSGLASDLEASGIEVIAPPLGSVARSMPRSIRRALVLPVMAASLWSLMRRRRPEAVHFFRPEAYLVGGVCAILAGLPVRVMSRRSLNDYQRGHPVLLRLERRLHRYMSAVLGNSRAVVAQLVDEGVPRERLGLIYNGIEPERFERARPREEVRTGLGVDVASLVLTTVANLIPYKGHDDLIEALARISPKLPEGWVLLCVGRDDGIGPALRARARALGLDGNVRWLGERHDVPELLLASDIGILASHQEGFSNSVLEGMAAGLSMIVTDAGGNAEAVAHDMCGLVVPPRDPEAMGKAILDLAYDPARRQRLGQGGRRRVAEEFSLESCVSRYERLYRALCDGGKVPVSEILVADPD